MDKASMVTNSIPVYDCFEKPARVNIQDELEQLSYGGHSSMTEYCPIFRPHFICFGEFRSLKRVCYQCH